MDRKKGFKEMANNIMYNNMADNNMMDIQDFFDTIEKEYNSSFYRHINISLKKNKKGKMEKIPRGEKNDLSVEDIKNNRGNTNYNTLSLAVKHIPDLYVVDFDTKEVTDCELYDLLNDDCVAYTPTTKGSHYYIKIKNIGEYPAYSEQQKIYVDKNIEVDLIKINNIWETKGRKINGTIKEYDWNDIKKYFNVTKMNFSNSPPASPPESPKQSEEEDNDLIPFVPSKKEYNIQEVQDCLKYLNNEECFEYATWSKIGMAIHTITNGDNVGLGMFVDFSKQDKEGYDLENIRSNWNYWKKKGTKVGLTTLRKLADKYKPIDNDTACEYIFKRYVETTYDKSKDFVEDVKYSMFFNGGRKKVLEYMNTKLIFVKETGDYIILDRKIVRKENDEMINMPCWYLKNPTKSKDHFRKENFTCKFGNDNDNDDDEMVFKMKPFDEWCEWTNRREVRAIGFDPRGDSNPDLFNLWNGFNIQKEEADEYDEKDAEPILQHIKELWCNGDDNSYNYILDLFAHYIQKPHVKTGVLLALKSKQGGGKGIILNKLAEIIGDMHYTQNSNAKFLFGDFNGQLEAKLVCNLDEAFWGGDKQLEGVVKNKITEKRQTINKKNKENYIIDCYCNYIITTNNDWFAGCSADDRRHYCLELSDFLCGRMTEEKMKIVQPVLDAPAEAFAKILYNRDISEFNPRIFKKTKLLQDQVERNWNSVSTWWNMVMKDGGFTIGDKFIEWDKLDKDDYGVMVGGRIIKNKKGEKKTVYYKDWIFDCYNNTTADNRKFSKSSFYRDLQKNCLGDLYSEFKLQIKKNRRIFVDLPSLEEARKKWSSMQEFDYEYDDDDNDDWVVDGEYDSSDEE